MLMGSSRSGIRTGHSIDGIFLLLEETQRPEAEIIWRHLHSLVVVADCQEGPQLSCPPVPLTWPLPIGSLGAGF